MKTKTTKKGETCTPISKSPRELCEKNLMQLKKKDLVYLATELISLSYHHIGDESTSFGLGWNESRRALIMLCNLNKYWDNE